MNDELIFDLGGVLLDLDMKGVAKACQSLGIDPALFFVKTDEAGTSTVCQGISASKAITDYQLGTMTTDEFLRLVGSQCAAGTTRDMIVRAWNACLVDIPRHRLDMLLELRRKGYRTHLLSNTNELHWQEIERRWLSEPGYTCADLFDHVFLSQELHLAKPDPEIYRHVLRQLGRPAAECVFIDDAQENVEAARLEGMQAFWLDVNRENALGEILSQINN